MLMGHSNQEVQQGQEIHEHQSVQEGLVNHLLHHDHLDHNLAYHAHLKEQIKNMKLNS